MIRVFLITVCLLSVTGIASSAAKSLSKTDQGKKSELLQSGNEFLRAEQYTKAIPLLEEANRLESDPEVVSSLILAYESQAELLAKKGLMDQALALLEKSKALSITAESEAAKERETLSSKVKREITNVKEYLRSNQTHGVETTLKESRARVLFEQAYQSYQQKQYGLARGLLQDGIKEDTQNPIAYELLGDIEYYSQNLKEAHDAYEKSYKLDTGERVKQKLEKLLREEKLETKLSEYLDEHFIIRYDREEDLEGFDVREYLRDSYRTISKDFGHYPKFKTIVVLYHKKQYHTIEQIPVWSGALFDGKIRIPIYEGIIDHKKLQKLIQHELTHVIVSDLSKNRAPVWLQEGLAQYEENKIIPIELSHLKNAIQQKSLLTSKQIQDGISQKDDESKALLFYQEVYTFTSYLIDQYRFYRIKELLKKLSGDLAFDDAFLEVYSVSLSEVHLDWVKKVNSGEIKI